MRLRALLLICFVFTGSVIFAQTDVRSAAYFQSFAHAVSLAAFRRQAKEIASSLDDNALAAQVLLTGIDGKLSLAPAMRMLLERIPAGGIMLFSYNLDSSKAEVKNLLSETSDLVAGKTGIPPFMAVDHEGGMVNRFGAMVEKLPSAFFFWELAQKEGRSAALARAETLYRHSALEIRDLGINLVLGPVAETLNDENRIFLETRSYGPDHEFTEAAASAFIISMERADIASAVKHFPGNSAIDPHSGVPELKAGKKALDEMVKPFAGIIRWLTPPVIMLSHVMVPALDSSRNASLSPVVIQNWLRGELGFEGIVLADDFSMGAVAASGISPGAAAVEALNAGADMIMVWPRDLVAVHSSILEALGEGRLSRNRLLEAASRIIAGKLRYALIPAL
ncbi:MAG: glycoside hydrolase family 3 protein [Treponema sp.]|jgi:beta-N-acetylhexosaminidase|nr:glycoside hydrolase family 3 protein [Treponema sp.]